MFAILLSLKLDKTIDWSLWYISAPLWAWKAIVLLGGLIGTLSYIRSSNGANGGGRRRRQTSPEAMIEFKAMIIAVFIHLFLLFFELFLCYQVEMASSYSHKWLFTFMPLFFLCPLTIAACVWGFKNDRSLEMEAIIASNVLLFIFVALKLDHIINWSWKAVFVPLWVVMCLPGVAALYYVVWALLFFRQPHYTADRKSSLTYATLWLLVVIPMIAFEVLLAFRLDNNTSLSYMNIFTPLHVCLFTLMISSCGGRGGNKWWFGMKTDFCSALLKCIPCLTIYGNIYIGEKQSESSTGSGDSNSDYNMGMDHRDDFVLQQQTSDTGTGRPYSIIRMDIPD